MSPQGPVLEAQLGRMGPGRHRSRRRPLAVSEVRSSSAWVSHSTVVPATMITGGIEERVAPSSHHPHGSRIDFHTATAESTRIPLRIRVAAAHPATVTRFPSQRSSAVSPRCPPPAMRGPNGPPHAANGPHHDSCTPTSPDIGRGGHYCFRLRHGGPGRHWPLPWPSRRPPRTTWPSPARPCSACRRDGRRGVLLVRDGRVSAMAERVPPDFPGPTLALDGKVVLPVLVLDLFSDEHSILAFQDAQWAVPPREPTTPADPRSIRPPSQCRRPRGPARRQELRARPTASSPPAAPRSGLLRDTAFTTLSPRSWRTRPGVAAPPARPSGRDRPTNGRSWPRSSSRRTTGQCFNVR